MEVLSVQEIELKPCETPAEEKKSKENNENEYDVALEFGESSITPPENIKQIMDSIIQDFGEIPEEYLEPAGNGGYNSNSENEETNNDYENLNYEFIYNEWDHARQKYRKDWCKLNEATIEGVDSNFIKETLRKHRGLLKNLNRTFEALRQDEKRLRKQNYGDAIDLDAFIDAYIDLKQGNEVDEKLFTKLNTMPWCNNGIIIVINVVSWPPCILDVEVNTPAGFPLRVLLNHSEVVPSKNNFIGAAILPKCVGEPIIRPSQLERSLLVAYKIFSLFAISSFWTLLIFGSVLIIASVPSTIFTPIAIF